MRLRREFDDARAALGEPRLALAPDGLATLDVVPSGELAAALAAVPGTPIAVSGAAWALRVGPERASSLAQIARRFGLRIDDRSRLRLRELLARRDVARPVVELLDHGQPRLSVLDEPSLGVEALRSIPGSATHQAAGGSRFR